MEKKLSKKTLAIVASGAVLLTGVGVGATFWAQSQDDVPTPTTSATPSPTSSSSSPEERPELVSNDETPSDMEETTQYQEGLDAKVTQVITSDYPEGENEFIFFNAVEIPAMWTIQKYIDGAVANPYFVADWWGEKDDNEVSGFSHFDKTLTPELLTEFTEKADAATATTPNAEAEAWLSARMFRPSELEVRPGCYEDWELTACWADENQEGAEILSAKGTFTSATSLRVETVVRVDVQYVHPELGDGNIASQARTYTLTFDLEYKNPVTAENKENVDDPYMVITGIEAGVVTDPVEDYILLSDLPPLPPVD